MRNPWLSSFAAAENVEYRETTRRKTVSPEISHGRRKRTKKSSAISSKEYSLVYKMYNLLSRERRAGCRVCDRREFSLKNYLKSSFVSDELARSKAQRTLVDSCDRIVAEPAATFRFHEDAFYRVEQLVLFAVPSRRKCATSRS